MNPTRSHPVATAGLLGLALTAANFTLGQPTGAAQTTVAGTTAPVAGPPSAAVTPQSAAAGSSSTTLTATASPTSIEIGDPVTLTVKLTPTSCAGTVDFTVGSASTDLGTAKLTDGTASLTTTKLPSGNHKVAAVSPISSSSSSRPARSKAPAARASGSVAS